MTSTILVLGDRRLAPRTLRALHAAGAKGVDLCHAPRSAWIATLAEAIGPLWCLRAGAWPARGGPLELPCPSATGLPLCAFGAVLPEAGYEACDEAADWVRLQASTGGDLAGAPLPPPTSVYLDSRLRAQLVQLLRDSSMSDEATVDPFADRLNVTTSRDELFEMFHTALARLLAQSGRGGASPPTWSGSIRVVRFAPLDVHFDDGIRCVQVVTSLQRGGAENIAVGLTEALPRCGVKTVLAALGRPMRLAFPSTHQMLGVDSAAYGATPAERIGSNAVRFGADIVHAHLLDREDMEALAATGVPLVATVHNARPGWPAGLEKLSSDTTALLVACSREVEDELTAAGLTPDLRTVWNGIAPEALERTPARCVAADRLRRQLGFSKDDIVLIAVANPRPQKRLDRLPAVLAATRNALARRGSRREARLILVGENVALSPLAQQSLLDFRAEVTRLHLETHVRESGAVEDVETWLVASDVLISSSAYEGLSLAQVEALAAGIWVVTTDAGGARELARGNPAVSVLPLEAGPEELAKRVVECAEAPPPPAGRVEVGRHFSRPRMAAGYARLYRAALRARQARGDGLLLVTNNFSTGGAQSSARRLLLGLAKAGRRVRAAVLEEQRAFPTPGRRQLLDAGIPVFAPSSTHLEPETAVDELLECIDRDPPGAVVFWNALTSCKLLLADALVGIPVYDVSPGEMFHDSLEKYFERPRPGLPYRDAADYGSRLTGVVVKLTGEASLAARTLRAPVHVIPNGVPLPDWSQLRQAPDPSGRLVLGTAVRLSPQKKIEQLLEAMRLARSKLPPHVLRIAGGVERGMDRFGARLMEAASDLDVEWVGELADTGPFLDGLDLFVLVAEPAGCPNASLEAMARSLPVVATDVGGMNEQIVDGLTGRLVSRGDVVALADAILDACGDPERLRRWGAAGRLRAEALFDVRRMLADYSRLFFGVDREHE